jgi:hypothetical protein
MGSNPNPQPRDIDARLQFLLQSTESLHATVHEMTGQIQKHTAQLQIDAENIRRLANIAGAHEDRLEDLDARLTRLEGRKKQ